MDGTFGGGDLISASLAIMLGGGTDAELHDKEVSLSTSQITGSQTAVFEYDPEDEDPQGTPPGPWDGYSLFTIDLSGVKNDVEAMRAQIAALEDALEEMQECCDEVVDVIHIYDENYEPHPVPPDPTNPTIPEKIQEIIDEESGYTFPPDDPDNPDPDRYDKIAELVGGDNLTDNDLHIIVKPMDDRYPITLQGKHNVYYGFFDSVTGAFIDRTQAFQGTIDPEHTDYVTGFRITDPSTGAYTFDWVTWGYLYNPPIWGWQHHTYTDTSSYLIGYGDPTHSYTVTNKKNS